MLIACGKVRGIELGAMCMPGKHSINLAGKEGCPYLPLPKQVPPSSAPPTPTPPPPVAAVFQEKANVIPESAHIVGIA